MDSQVMLAKRPTTKRLVHAALALSVFLAASPVAAIVVRYSFIALGGQRYRYVYTIENDGSLGAGAPVALFGVSFDPDLYRTSSLSLSTPLPLSIQWDEKLLAEAPGVPVSYDARASSGGVAVGSTLGGFSVSFDWLGTGTPGAQPFQMYDPTTFDRIEQGITVDAPPAPWLAATLLTTLLARRRSRQRKASR